MGFILSILGGIAGLGSLICFIYVIIQFFQKGEQKMGIICLCGLLLCGIGALVAFIYGWMKAKPLGLEKIMLYWTICFVVGLVLNGASAALMR